MPNLIQVPPAGSRVNIVTPTHAHATVTLFVNRVPRAERLVYHEQDDAIRFQLLEQSGGDNPWTPLHLQLQAQRPDGSPVSGSFSMLAWNSSLEQSIDSLANLRNYLLFNSDLQGEMLPDFEALNPNLPGYSANG